MANYFNQNKHKHYMSQQSLSFSNSIFGYCLMSGLHMLRANLTTDSNLVHLSHAKATARWPKILIHILLGTNIFPEAASFNSLALTTPLWCSKKQRMTKSHHPELVTYSTFLYMPKLIRVLVSACPCKNNFVYQNVTPHHPTLKPTKSNPVPKS